MLIAQVGLQTHSKLVSLHRRFLNEGLEPGSPYAASADACIKSSRIAIMSLHNLKEVCRNEWLSRLEVPRQALQSQLTPLFSAYSHALSVRDD